jgi:bifunctional non-homologous end joining protein LigD
LTELPLVERKQRLKALLEAAQDPLRYSAAFQGSTEALLEHARKNRIEGIIGKRADSIYRPGRRSSSWVKVKIICEQEFVIGGYTQPKGAREHFGAILVGYYADGGLRFASKVGTGFDSETLDRLFRKFQRLQTSECPFTRIDARPASRGGLTPAEKGRCTWLKPELVCQVKFAEWTQDGGLRQPVFLGLRDDKPAREVVREQPVEAE